MRHTWLEKNNIEETERAIPELAPLYMRRWMRSTPAICARWPGTGLNLSINPEEPANLARLQKILDLEPADEARA